MSLKRIAILVRKEFLQVVKDRSIILLVTLLPVMLVIIYGYALRMDAKPIALGIVNQNQSSIGYELQETFCGSEYFDVTVVSTLHEGREMLTRHDVKSLLIIPPDFSVSLNHGDAELMILINGTEAQLASISLSYIQNAILEVLKNLYQNSVPLLNVNDRNWFNEENESVWFLMSGQYVGIVTLMCAFLGSFVISREWDRKTIESLCATNASALEIVLSKAIVYYLMSLIGLALTLISGELLLNIPIRGNIPFILCCYGVYCFEMISLGLLISALTHSQFLSVEYAVIVGFLPTVLLSGLIFDLDSVAPFIRIIGYCLPPTYMIQAMRVNFLSGGAWDILLRDLLIQLLFAALFFAATVLKLRRDTK